MTALEAFRPYFRVGAGMPSGNQRTPLVAVSPAQGSQTATAVTSG